MTASASRLSSGTDKIMRMAKPEHIFCLIWYGEGYKILVQDNVRACDISLAVYAIQGMILSGNLEYFITTKMSCVDCKYYC